MEVLNYSEFRVTEEMLASKSNRFVNYIIDRIVFTFILIVIIVIAGLIAELLGSEAAVQFFVDLEYVNPILDRLISAIVILFFYMILEGLTQRTIGKLVTRTKVVLENGEKPSPETIVIRSLCRIIPFEPFSFFGNSQRGWHDTLSKTYVVDIRKFDEHKKAHTGFQLLGKRKDIDKRLFY
ncbi:MAG: hypothetical protein COA67_04425 [Lutibacter sp.]|nr:MAG: hypothetical protein COA67_04425 [Lutibacter sp.]